MSATVAASEITAQLLHAAQLSLGIVFAASAWAKLRDPARFAEVVRSYAILPRSAATGAAWLVIVLETALAAAFVTGAAAGAAAFVCGALLAAFLVAVAVVLRRGEQVSCGCFGADDELVSRATAARLLAMSAATWAIAGGWAAAHHDPLTVWAALDRGRAGIEDLVVASALACAALVVATYAANAPALRALWRAQGFGARAGTGTTSEGVSP